jgi:hypothetical protein
MAVNRFLQILAAAIIIAAWLYGPAHAETRMALVIGNSHYRSVSALPNPANDAKAVGELLTSAGFQIISASDLSLADMRVAIREFISLVSDKGADTVALVFFAGHGLQVDGENYLVPVDADIKRESDVPIEALRLGDVMNALSGAPARTRIVILDACRNNPFSDINKTAGRGLAIVDAPNGSIVAYSTAPGSEAEDGIGANSPFTAAFTSVAKEPGLPIELALKRVRLAVNQLTNGRQTPWESSSLSVDFSFFPGSAGSQVSSKADKQTAAGGQPATKPAGFWRTALQAKSESAAYDLVIQEDAIDGYQEFVALYPEASLVGQVRSILGRRMEMLAWYTAVSLNSFASYEAFLASYPNSDLASTARRLQERAQQRPQTGGQEVGAARAAASTAGLCPCGPPISPTRASAPGPSSPAPTNVPSPGRPQGALSPLPGPPPQGTSQPPGPPPVVLLPPDPEVIVIPPIVRPPYRPPVGVVHPPGGRPSGSQKPPSHGTKVVSKPPATSKPPTSTRPPVTAVTTRPGNRGVGGRATGIRGPALVHRQPAIRPAGLRGPSGPAFRGGPGPIGPRIGGFGGGRPGGFGAARGGFGGGRMGGFGGGFGRR